MMKNIFLLFSILFISALFAQELEKNLSELTAHLNHLHSILNKKITTVNYEKYFESEEIAVPPEIKQFIIEKIIPESFGAEDITQQIATFKKTLENLSKASRISKEYNEALEDPYFKKIIVHKLFSLMNPQLLDQLITIPKKFIDNPQTISGIVNNILYSIHLLKKGASSLEIDKAIRCIVDSNIKGMDANFFIGQDSLLDIAIKANLPDTVQFLIQKGADVNLKNKSGQIPFNLAFHFSLKSALNIIKNKNVDFELIKKNSKNNRFPLLKDLNYKYLLKIVKILFNHSFSPNDVLGITAPIKYDRTPHISLFGFVVTCSPNSIELIKQMLDKGADIHQVVPLMFYNTSRSPLGFAEEHQAEYPELYQLLKQYDKDDH